MENEEILQKVYELVSNIKDTQSEIKTELAAHAAAQSQLCQTRGDCLNKLSEKVLGNGKPGVIAELEDVKKELSVAKYILAAIVLPLMAFFGAWAFNKIDAPPAVPTTPPAKTIAFDQFVVNSPISQPYTMYKIDKQGKVTKQ